MKDIQRKRRKRQVLKSSLLGSLTALALLLPSVKNPNLTDITSPHLGFYECEYARLSGEELSGDFEYIYLELKANETFEISYCKKGGKVQKEQGNYRYDKEKESVTFSLSDANVFKRTFPLKDGELLITLRFGGKTLNAKFKQK